jgi:hypothetical protein
MAVFFKATSDFQDVVKDYEKLQRANVKLKEKIRDVTTAGKAQKTQRDSFFKGQISQVKSTLAGWASIEGAVRLVGSALRFAQEETEGAVGSMDRLFEARRRLAQIALSGKDLDTIDKQADSLAAQSGVERGAARQIVFDARSLGVEEALPEIFKFTPVLDPGTATTAAGKLPKIFKGQINEVQALNLAFSASRESALSFEDLMQSLPTAAQGVSLAGGSATEAAALVSVLSEETANKAEAGQLVKSFGIKVGIDRELFPEKQGILSAVAQLDNMPEEQKRGFLQENQELNVAYQKIRSNMAKIKERQTTIQNAIDTAGTVESPLEQARFAVFDPSTDLGRQNLADLERRKAAIRRETVREDRFAESGAEAEAARDTVLADLDEVQANPLTKFASYSVAEAGKFLGLSGDAVAPSSLLAAESVELGLREVATKSLPFVGSLVGDVLPTAGQRVAELRNDQNESSDESESLRVQESSNSMLSEIRDGILELVGVQTTPVTTLSNRETR